MSYAEPCPRCFGCAITRGCEVCHDSGKPTRRPFMAPAMKAAVEQAKVTIRKEVNRAIRKAARGQFKRAKQ